MLLTLTDKIFYYLNTEELILITRLLTVVIFGFSSMPVLADEKEQDLCVHSNDVSNISSNSYRSKIIYNENYDAFPYVTKIGNSIVGIFSTGVGHGASSKQVMFRSDDNGLTFTTTDFFVKSGKVFNFDLISDLLAEGEAINLKIWHVKKSSGILTATNTSIIDGYSVWSKPKTSGSSLYRTGYNSDRQTALLESFDDGATWAVKSIIAPKTSGKRFSEADIVNTYSDNWVAYIREDKSKDNNLYRSTSTNNGNTWSTPTAVNPRLINGRQPNLTKLDDGSIILVTGDRTGNSGYASGSGNIVYGNDTTGITIFRSTNNGKTWSLRKRVSPIYSTDGGQPSVVDLSNGKIFIVWYARKTTKGKPSINSCTINVNSL